MKWLFTCMCMLFLQTGVHAQTDEDAAPMLRPKLLALDTTISVANHFNDELSKVMPGYKLAFTDGQGKTVKKVYKTESNETLKLEYTYSLAGANEDEAGNGSGKPVIIFQRVCCSADMMAKVYSYLFGTEITAAQLPAYSTPGIDIEYMGKTHQFILEPDDYGPGYWLMTFLK